MMVLTIASSMVLVQTVYAQCGLPGTPPCAPAPGGSGGDKQRRPTKTPTATPRPTATATTQKPSVLMPLGGGDAALTATAAWLQTWVAETNPPTATPSRTPTPSPLGPPPERPIVTPVAGPLFLLPGQIWMIIIVALVAVVAAGLILVLRGR